MENNLLFEARNFSESHFRDARLTQNQFIALIELRVQELSDHKEKLIFISEIIRLGELYVNRAVNKLFQLEHTAVSSIDFDTCYN